MVTGDFNGDGKTDIAVTNFDGGTTFGNTVSVLLGNGSGGFGAPTTYAVGSGPEGITTADLANDGKLDLVVANSGSGTISVLMGDGSGGFGPQTTYAAGSYPLSVTLADVNGDGKLDAVVAAVTSGVVILLGDGSGGFGAPTTYASGTYPGSIATAELKGPGTRPDIIVNGSADIAVLVPPPPVLTETLASDTGASASDKVTKNPALTGTGEANLVVTISNGATVLGSTTADAQGNWSFTPTLADGSYTLTASETDQDNNTGTTTLTFTLDTTAPLVTEALTTDTGVSASDDITSNPALSGAGDPNAVVTLTEGTNVLGTTTANGDGTWTFTPTLADGSHTIVASETDLAGNIGTATLTFTLLTSVPAINETLAQDTGVSASDHITSNPALSGGGAANAVVTLSEGTTVIGSTTASNTGAWTFTPTLADGAHTIVANETDAAGNTGSSTLTFTLATSVPAINETLAQDTGVSASDHITSNPALSGGGAANAVVTLTEGTTVIGSTTANGDGAWTFTPTLADGAHTLVASETDAAGNTGSSTLTFTLATSVPAINETLAQDTGVSASDHITSNPALSGGGAANAVVTLSEGTTVIGSTTASNTGAWTFTPTLADGAHTIVANETDAAGNTGSSTLTFTLDTATPVVTETLAQDTGVSASDHITSNPALSGGSGANAVVTLTEGTTVIGSTTASNTGAWTFTPTLADGVHTVVASETDIAGTTGTATLTFTLATILPDAPVITSADLTDVALPVLTGTAEAGSTVTLTVDGVTYSTVATGGAWSVDLSTATPVGGILSLNENGANSVSATATDPAGNISMPATQTLTIDTTAPDAPVITSADLTDVAAPVLTGTAEAGSTVTLTVDGVTYSTVATGGAWSVDLSTATPVGGILSLNDNGANSVSATATDPAGNTSTPATQTLTIDTTAPAAPASLALTPGSDSGVLGDGITDVTHPTITGTGETGDTLTLYDGEVAIGTTTVVNGTWSVTPSVALINGSHSLTAKQADPAGNVSAASLALPLVIDATLPAAPSSLALAAGSDSGTLGDGITSATSPVITGTGTAGDTVKVYDGTTLLGTTTVADGGAWSFTDGPLADAAYSLTATQADEAGNVSAASAAFALTIDTAAPAVTAALAANPHNTASMTYNQVLDGGGDANASVTISDGGTVVATVLADATGAWSFDLAGLAAGSHSLVARETNAAGTTGASAAVPLSVAPAVVPDTRFTVATGDAATSGKFFGSDYAGPLPGLQAQYGYVGIANANVVANVANTFIYSGTGGEDALVAKGGSNVIDSRGGSDWMVGASGADGGTDTFFVDSRASGSPTTWDTALNFHLGDKLTLWDFDPAAGSMSFADNLGQPGYTGTTLLASLGNGATDLVTFAGLSGGAARFATSTGTSGGLGYLALTRVA